MSNVVEIRMAEPTLGKIVAVISIKGGVGKTTMACNILAWLRSFGYRVTLVDCDERANRGATNWISGALPDVPIHHISDPSDLWEQLPEFRKGADFVIVDSPGSSELIRQLLLRADHAIIPAKAGRLEAPALVENVRLLRQAQELRHGQPQGHVVMSQIGKSRRGAHRKLTREMHALAEKLNMPLASVPLWLSELHPQAATELTFLWNMGAKAKMQAGEMDKLLYELLPETKPPLENMA